MKTLQPWVIARRKRWFGSLSPPFRSLDDAAAWIERETGVAIDPDSPEVEALGSE